MPIASQSAIHVTIAVVMLSPSAGYWAIMSALHVTIAVVMLPHWFTVGEIEVILLDGIEIWSSYVLINQIRRADR